MHNRTYKTYQILKVRYFTVSGFHFTTMYHPLLFLKTPIELEMQAF